MRCNLLATCTSVLCLICSSVVRAELPTAQPLVSPPPLPTNTSSHLGTSSKDARSRLYVRQTVVEASPSRVKSGQAELKPSGYARHPAISSPELVAQQTSPSVPPGTLQQPRPGLPPLPETLPTPIPTPVPIPTPQLTPEQTIPPSSPGSLPEAKIKVERVEVLGSTAFSPEELKEVVRPFEGKELTLEQILDIRTAVTDLYTRNGYTTSGAFLQQQDLSTGTIAVQVVEGELERLNIQGLSRVRENYVRSRINRAAGKPLNLRRLEQALQLLQLDPLFSRVQADLKTGTAPGRSVLTLSVEEAPAIDAAYQVANQDSPSVGSIRNSAIFIHRNLLGFGDRLGAEAGFTEGISSYEATYNIPFNARNGTLNLRYARSNQTVVEEPFAPLDLTSNAQTISVGFRQPLILTPTTEFALSLTGDLRRSETFLLGNIPFSFTEGPQNGLSKVSALRFSQDWTQRSSTQVLAARSQFSFGLPIFGATENPGGIADGRFFSWVGQFQWVQALGTNGIVSVARVATQLTPDALLPLEQFSIGGIDTVRGYRQNQRVGDNGVIGSLEVRFPIVNQPDGIGLIQLAPFFDFGTIWNNRGATTNPSTLVSTGIGLRWDIDDYFAARLDYGIRLNPIEQMGDTLQDNGITFSLFLKPFSF